MPTLPRRPGLWLVLAVAAVTLVTLACDGPRTLPPCVETRPPGSPGIETGGDPVVLAAGDISDVENLRGAEATAKLLDAHDGLVLAIGDTVQGDGTLDELLDGYGPTWGRHRWRTRAVPGNHEYRTPHAGPYFAYFCAAAGPTFKGFYSFDVGTWHVVALDSICADASDAEVECAAGSEQEQWLRADLAAHPARCTLAFWHHGRFSSSDGDNPATRDLWRALYDARAELVLNGHAHEYERFAPQTPDGLRDAIGGIREIVVGTGGAPLGTFGVQGPNSEVRVGGHWGVLKLTLRATEYAWQLLTTDGRVSDEGSASCH
jgi:hypothetical protein